MLCAPLSYCSLEEVKYGQPVPDSPFNGRGAGGGGGDRNDDSPLISPVTPTAPNADGTPPGAKKSIQIDPTGTGGYSAVNVLSILPDEVRTEENLEGGSLPPEQAQKLLSDYNKQRKEYEERELRKMAAASATATQKQPPSPAKASPPASAQRGAVKALNFTPGYEDIDQRPSPGYDMVVPPMSRSAPVSRKVNGSGAYEDPADALPREVTVPHLHGNKGAVVAPKSQISPNEPKFQFSTSAADERYTEVFNPGEGETIGQQTTTVTKSMSDSTPHHIVNGSHSPGKQLHHYQNTVGGELGNSSGGSMDDEPGMIDRKEPGRESKRKSAKEVVEFDPTAKKVFRVTSTKKKQAVNGRDLPDGESSGDSSPDAKSHDKGKQFSLSGEQSGEDYSMVNVADKQKYRTEDDTIKKEGSGVPQRYTPKSPVKQEVA